MHNQWRTVLVFELYLLIKGFTNRLKKDNVSAFAAQAAFFIIMCIFPFFSVLLTLIKYLPISQKLVTETIMNIIPKTFEPMAENILEELFVQSYSTTVLSLSVVLAVWSAAKAVLAIIRGLNSVFHVEDKRNYFVLRLLSSMYTIILISAIVVSLLLIVFGNQIYYALKKDFPMVAGFISVFIKQKLILSICILTLFFMMIYRLVGIKHSSPFTLIPGAIFSSISWIGMSYVFSLYIDKYSNFSYTYGSLATLVLFMFWIYFCMYLLFVGAEINSYFKIYFESAKKYRKNKKLKSFKCTHTHN